MGVGCQLPERTCRVHPLVPEMGHSKRRSAFEKWTLLSEYPQLRDADLLRSDWGGGGIQVLTGAPLTTGGGGGV